MSTLIKFQQLRASSKITKKNNIIICLGVTRHKIQKPYLLDQKSVETVCPKENCTPRNLSKSSQFTYRKESSQPIWNTNQLTGIWHISKQTEFCFAVSEQALADNRRINKWQVTCFMYNLFDRCKFCRVCMGSFLDTKI